MRRLAGIISSLSSQQSYSFHSVWNNSLYCEPQGQTASTFPSRGEEKKERKRNAASVRWVFSFCDKSWPPDHWKQFPTWKETFCIWKCTLNGVNNIPEVRAESPWRLNLAAALRDQTPPLSGGSVMALSFSRHVPGSFDTGNMHAGWQCLGCAAETMMYISFSSLTDWRL